MDDRCRAMIHCDGKRLPQGEAHDDDEKLIEDIVDLHPDLRHHHARTETKKHRF